ncbi:MAG: TIGR02281 family clan AA aspartic protease [Erythrobacter sp.]|nr:TIGR02281 family clan AA aspartic protease [Erythrobacter sp.]
MDFAPAFDAAADIVRAIPRSELLMMALAAVIGGMIGSAMIRHRVPLGRLLRTLSTLALVAVLVTVVLQLSRFDPRLEVAVPQLGLPEQVVAGGETRVEMASDGHFWLDASLNGVPARFLIDTGATVTAVSEEVAARAGLQPRRGGVPVRIATANGAMNAEISSADNLSFGNVEARGVDVVIAPSLGTTNVLGMNVLSRLQSWRVEGRTLILVPAEGDRS